MQDETLERNPTAKKIIIIGSGVSGLSLLSALLHLRKTIPQLNIDPILYTKSTPAEFTCLNGLGNQNSEKEEIPSQGSVHFNQTHDILWKSGLKAALELGIGGRLGRVGWPVVTVSSFDIGKNPAVNLVDWSTVNNPSLERNEGDTDHLPPMIALKHVDVIRALLTRIAGHPELVQGSSKQDFIFKPSNNSPTSQHAPSLSTHGMEADLADGNWYHTQGFAELIPYIKFSHELESYVISAQYGTVYLKFTNGVREKAYMLLGADGADSTVRSLLLSDRCPLQYTKQLCIKGTTSILAPPISSPSNVPDSSIPINPLSRSQLLEFVKDGESKSWVIGSAKIGVVNMGNERIGWTLIVPQENPGEIADRYTLPIRRHALGLGLGSGYVGNVVPSVPSLDKFDKRDSAASWQEWKVSGPDNNVQSSSIRSLPVEEVVNQNIDNVELPSISQNSKNDASKDLLSKTTATVPATFNSMPNVAPLLNSTTFGSSDLSGHEARDLALHLLSKLASSHNGSPIPSSLLSIISQTDTSATIAFDNVDLHGEHVPTVYSSPKYHPGRVMLVGDAAHAMTEGVHGSHALGFCLSDAVCLAKLIGFYLSPDGMNYYSEIIAKSTSSDMNSENYVEGGMTLDMHLLAKISSEYSSLRASVGVQAVSDSHSQSSWCPFSPDASFVWKSLTLFAGLRRESWALGDSGQNQFEVEMDRGKPVMPSIAPGFVWPSLS